MNGNLQGENTLHIIPPSITKTPKDFKKNEAIRRLPCEEIGGGGTNGGGGENGGDPGHG